MKQIAKITDDGPYWKVVIFRSLSKAANDMGITKQKFSRKLRKHDLVRDGDSIIYVEPERGP